MRDAIARIDFQPLDLWDHLGNLCTSQCRLFLGYVRTLQSTLLMTMNDYGVQWGLTSRTSLLVGIVRVQVVVHLDQTIELRLLVQHIYHSFCPAAYLI
jgi:hypothetical protein